MAKKIKQCCKWCKIKDMIENSLIIDVIKRLSGMVIIIILIMIVFSFITGFTFIELIPLGILLFIAIIILTYMTKC